MFKLNFNFCPLAWYFCTETNTKKMEKLQERGLRFVYNDFSTSYEELLTKAKLSTLHIRRMRTMAIETFRILNSLAPPILSNLLKKRGNIYNFRYSNILRFQRSEPVNLVRILSGMLTLCCGTSAFLFGYVLGGNRAPFPMPKSTFYSQFLTYNSQFKPLKILLKKIILFLAKS